MKTKENNSTDYVSQSIQDYQELLTSNQRNAMKIFSRINQGEIFVLQYLISHSEPVLPSELSEALGSSKGRISSLLGVLEGKGYIERNIDKSNRRNILVTITDAGRKSVNADMNAIKKRLAGIFSEMGQSDTIDFLRLFKKFLTTAQKYLADFE